MESAAGRSDDRQGSDLPSLEQQILSVIAKELKRSPEELNRDITLDELHVASLDAIEMVFALEERFDISIPYTVNSPRNTGSAIPFRTLGDVIDAVTQVIADARSGRQEDK